MRKLHIKLPHLLTDSKYKLGSVKHKALTRYGKIKNHFRGAGLKGLVEAVLAVIIVLSFLALLGLIFYQVRDIKTAVIKVPVATDKASYYAGQDVSGIFFGDIYYRGQVSVLREVFCRDYQSVIMPPKGSGEGQFFSTQSVPRHLEGESVKIGQLPQDMPLGSNCVLQFTNVYNIGTPFGTRRIEYQYYTQNFSIITKEQRQQLDTPDSGTVKTEDLTTGQSDQTIDSGSGDLQKTKPSQIQKHSEPVTPPKDCGFIAYRCWFD